MTRHELKEQLQHDHFTDTVSGVVGYAQTHRDQVIRWAVALVIVLVIAGGVFWYEAYRSSVRTQDLQAAFSVLEAPVGPANANYQSYPTEQAKRQASIQALSRVVAKDAGSRQGFVAEYYLGTLKAQNGDSKGAETDLSAAAKSGSEVAPLAKIALAQLYAGQNRIPEAQKLLHELIDKPSSLVSKAQAQILLAKVDATANPKEAKNILQSLKTPTEDPAVARAADEISSQLAK